jgi:hypothetical protein
VVRKISLVLIILAGAFWVATALVLNYPTKTQAVDHLTNSFRPAFTDAALAQSAADLRTSSTFADDFRMKAAPALAQRLHVTPEQFLTAVDRQYPAVGAGLTQLPQILGYFNSVHGTMADQQTNFHQVDAIPTKNLPNTTVTWLFLVPGILAIVLGVAGFFFWPRATPMLAPDRLSGRKLDLQRGTISGRGPPFDAVYRVVTPEHCGGARDAGPQILGDSNSLEEIVTVRRTKRSDPHRRGGRVTWRT